jgi:hypothetical protein
MEEAEKRFFYEINGEKMKTLKHWKNICLLLSVLIIVMSGLSGCGTMFATVEPKSGENDNLNTSPNPVLLEDSDSPSDEDALKTALAAHLGTNVRDLAIVIDENIGTYARGGVDNGYFLAAKVNGQWQVVADGQGALDCLVVSQYGFPPSMVPECSAAPAPLSDDDALKAALAAHLGMNVNDLTIVINENTGSYARGGVDNGYFLAAKVNSQWQIVADGQRALDCLVVSQYSFPPSMVPECSAAPAPLSDDDALKESLAAHLGMNVNDLTIVINENTGSYARGGVDNGYFLAAKVNGQWQIVADGQGALDCQVLSQYSFPPSMVPECSAAPAPLSDDDALKESLAAHLGMNVNDLTIVIDQNTGLFARGGVDNGYFLAAKVNSQWQIVADGQGALDCQVVSQYGFPPSMVPECLAPSFSSIPSYKISFKPGGTYAFAQRSIKAGSPYAYTLRALAGQTIILSIASPDNDVFLANIAGIQGGQQLIPNNAKIGSWTCILPQTQDYQITLTTNNPDTYYFFTVEIPANIQFEPGTYSADLNGHIEEYDHPLPESSMAHVTYLVYASAGQTMDVKLISPNIDALSLAVYGQQDGQVYQHYEVKNSGYYGTLPVTQSYYLKVVSIKPPTDFTLEITIW